MKEITEGVYTWSVFNEAKNIDFNGHYLTDGDVALLVDPPALTDADVTEIEERGRPARIVLTNKDHRRDAPTASHRFDAPIWIHEADADLINCEVFGTFADGEHVEFLRVIRVPDSKSPGECALYWEDKGVLILGDALIGRVEGELRLLPDEKFGDPAKARAGLSVFEGLSPTHVLVGDGHSIHEGAAAALKNALTRP